MTLFSEGSGIKNMRDPDLFDSKSKHKKVNIVRRGEAIDLEELEKQGEKFKCVEGCHMCCEPLNITKDYWEKHKDKALYVYEVYEVDGMILPIRQYDDHCVFMEKDGCLVYDDRPIVCRIYGLDSGFECPLLNPDGTPRKRNDRRRRVREYEKALGATMYQRVLHRKRDCKLIWKEGMEWK